ncbi:hypothetical protein HPCPY6271_1208 [Helicobacter pylori CPY6271]|nr:hypothetical protein HPCPY6271_1208 [Helicobacter pylori CPY6271]
MHTSLSSVFYHQARFFVTPAIKPSLIAGFLKQIGYSDFILKSALALANPRQ